MTEQPAPEGVRVPAFFWLIVVSSILSLGGGATLLFLSQSGRLGAGAVDGPGLTSEVYVAGQRVEIWRNESWHPGTVTSVDGLRYRVRYDQANVFVDETLDASRLRAGR
jgi:hypothetical protein